MPLLAIDLEEPLAPPEPKIASSTRIVFGSTNLARGLMPGRGLLYSFLVHELAIFSLITYYSYRIFAPLPLRPPDEYQMVNLNEPNQVIYLPNLGGGSKLSIEKSTRSGTRGARKPIENRQSKIENHPGGLIYPGPQPIVSDVPNPTNSVQTILQPDLKRPPVIKEFVPLPNIVQMAQAAPPPPPRPERIVAPAARLEPTRLPDVPNLNIPRTAPQTRLPVMPAAKAPDPRIVAPAARLEAEKLPDAPNLNVPRNAPQSRLPIMPAAKAPDPRIVAPAARLEAEKLPEAPNPNMPRNAPQNHLPVMPTAKAPEPRVVVPQLPAIENLKSKIENPLDAPKLEVPTSPVHTLAAMSSAKLATPPPLVPKLPAIENLKSKIQNPQEAPNLGLPASGGGPANLSAMPSAKPPETAPVENRQQDSRLAGNEQGRAGGVPGGQPGGTGTSAAGTVEGKDTHNLLALSPMPAPVTGSVKIPAGEARGRFAIGPEGSPGDANAPPGSKSGSASNSAIGIGHGAGADADAGAGTGKSGTSGKGGEGSAGAGGSANGSGSGGAAAKGEGAGSGVANGSGSGEGAGTGSAKGEGAGLGKEGAGNGTGHGLGTGSGRGTGGGSGTGSGNGNGAGTGSGTGAFPGISIQGGSLQSGAATSGKSMVRVTPSESPKRSYSLTVVSTSSSGGGLADFGVFRNERVYTVYLDMRKSVEDPAPSWTLQYAVQGAADAVAGAPGSPITIQQSPAGNGGGQGLVPPFPLVKEQPHFPPELAQKYQRRQLVISAVINKEGKFEQIVVKQSPNSQLNAPLLEALGKWTFRPAELKGEKVPVKTLLGIPVALPQ